MLGDLPYQIYKENDEVIHNTPCSAGKVTTEIPYQEQLAGYTLLYLLEEMSKQQYIDSITELNHLFQFDLACLKKKKELNLKGKRVQIWYLDSSFYLEENQRKLEYSLSHGKIDTEKYKLCQSECRRQLFAMIPLTQGSQPSSSMDIGFKQISPEYLVDEYYAENRDSVC